MAAKKKAEPTPTAVIIACIACAVIVLAILMEYLASGKGLLGQKRVAESEDSE